MNYMKAITRKKYGSPEVLQIQEIEKPTPDANQLLVRVHATTVNRTDCAILSGKPFVMRFISGLFKPKAAIPGTDFAGQVEAVGANVKSFKVGDKVWGLNDEGLSSHAQYMLMDENQSIVTMPNIFSYAESVACAEGAHYAYNVLNKVKISEGDRVLINGATGAIGSACLQILRSMNAEISVVGNTKNIELLKSLGAEKVYDYLKEDFTKSARDKYKYIFDTVGKSTFGACKHLLEDNGVYISSELGPNNENLYLPLMTKLKGGKRVLFPIPSDCKRSLLFVKNLIEAGKFKAVIDKKYTMEEIKSAYYYVISGEKTGNVVISYS